MAGWLMGWLAGNAARRQFSIFIFNFRFFPTSIVYLFVFSLPLAPIHHKYCGVFAHAREENKTNIIYIDGYIVYMCTRNV